MLYFQFVDKRGDFFQKINKSKEKKTTKNKEYIKFIYFLELTILCVNCCVQLRQSFHPNSLYFGFYLENLDKILTKFYFLVKNSLLNQLVRVDSD